MSFYLNFIFKKPVKLNLKSFIKAYEGINYLPGNIEVINGSLRLSADQRVINNETILNASWLFNARGGRNEGVFEMRAKFPNGHCLKSAVWFDQTNSDSEKSGNE